MLCVIVGDTKEYRKKIITKIINTTETSPEGVIVLTDNDGDITRLQEYLYPSLFSSDLPVVHAKYILSISELYKKNIEELHSSPTLYLLEEISITTEQKKMLHSVLGDHLYIEEKKQKNKIEKSSPFGFIDILEKKSKKDIWVAYNTLLSQGTIESAMGIILWGVRKLALQKGAQQKEFQKLYHNLMHAYAQARTYNVPLSLMIEKVLLQK